MDEPQTAEIQLTAEEHAREMTHVGAVHRLAMCRVQHPQLVRIEAQARVALAAAILTMDEVEDRIATGEKIHSLQEQANVELATSAYARALANLLRGEG